MGHTVTKIFQRSQTLYTNIWSQLPRTKHVHFNLICNFEIGCELVGLKCFDMYGLEVRQQLEKVHRKTFHMEGSRRGLNIYKPQQHALFDLAHLISGRATLFCAWFAKHLAMLLLYLISTGDAYAGFKLVTVISQTEQAQGSTGNTFILFDQEMQTANFFQWDILTDSMKTEAKSKAWHSPGRKVGNRATNTSTGTEGKSSHFGY